MKKRFLETGKIVGTHGVKGMVRIQPWCDDIEFLDGFKRFYLDSEGTKFLEKVRVSPNGNVAIAKFKGIETIEEAEKYRNKIIYIDRNDVKHQEGYFIQDLIGCEVYEQTDGRFLGKISDVSQTGANDVWHISNEGKEYLIPVIDEVVVKVDIDSEKVFIVAMKGIFDDED